MKQYILLIFALFLSTVNVMGQTKNAYLNAAQIAYDNEDYYSAFSYYQEVLKFDVEDINLYYQAANAARKFRAYIYADTLYSKVLAEEDDNQFPDAMFYAASVKQKLGEYDKAKEYYSLYLSEQGGENEFMTQKAQKEIKAIDWALEQIELADETGNTESERLQSVNTPHSEFGAYKLGDSLYFTSLRFEIEKKDVFPTKTYSRILLSQDSTDDGEIIGKDLSPIDTRHIAHTSFNGDKSIMYFTICEYRTADNIRCDLYSVAMKDGNIDGTPHKINIKDGDTLHTFTQPAWAELADGKEVLFFVSDMEGGEGLNDIWYTAIQSDSSYGEPVNVRDLNTAYNDITPYYDQASSTLYFSSDGYLGFGGYDIFSSQITESGWSKAYNVGAPLNSSFNDIYPMIDNASDKVYYSSNRKGSLYLDAKQKGCCYDIYKGELPYLKHKLIVQVYDDYTRDSIFGAEVSLLSKVSENLIDKQQDQDSMQYAFKVKRNKEYIIKGIKEGYLPEEVTFSTVNVPDTGDIIKKIFLKTEDLHLDVFVWDARDKSAIRGAEVTLIDNEENTIDTITLASNDFHFVLDRDKTYTIIASRKGFKPATVQLNPADYRNQSLIRKDLYLLVGGLKDFLPLVLYFDNDKPNSNSWSKSTNILYTETFPPYFDRMNTFIDIYGAPLDATGKERTATQFDNFFYTEVKKGNDDLITFLGVLDKALEKGKEVEIYLKGYTSPRASEAYNIILGMRRIQSVKNNFVEFSDGKLLKYMKSGQLEIRLKSFGETTAPSDVISDLKDERNSIYSYKASKERRVEIIGVNIEE